MTLIRRTSGSDWALWLSRGIRVVLIVREVYAILVERKDVRKECDVKENTSSGGAAPKGVDSEADGAEPSVSSTFSPIGWSK